MLLQFNRWLLLVIWAGLCAWFTYYLIEAVWLSSTTSFWGHDHLRAATGILMPAVFALISVRVGIKVFRREPLRALGIVGVLVLLLYFLTFELFAHRTPWWAEFAIATVIVGLIDTSIALWPRPSSNECGRLYDRAMRSREIPDIER